MKRILVIFIILLSSCHLKKEGKLVPNKPAILLDKEAITYSDGGYSCALPESIGISSS